jgi:hypothetical protein
MPLRNPGPKTAPIIVHLVLAYVLICHVGDFNLRSIAHSAILGLGFLLMGLMSARHFGRFQGGNSPEASNARSR